MQTLFLWQLDIESGRLMLVRQYDGGNIGGLILASKSAAFELFQAIERHIPVNYKA